MIQTNVLMNLQVNFVFIILLIPYNSDRSHRYRSWVDAIMCNNLNQFGFSAYSLSIKMLHLHLIWSINSTWLIRNAGSSSKRPSVLFFCVSWCRFIRHPISKNIPALPFLIAQLFKLLYTDRIRTSSFFKLIWMESGTIHRQSVVKDRLSLLNIGCTNRHN